MPRVHLNLPMDISHHLDNTPKQTQLIKYNAQFIVNITSDPAPCRFILSLLQGKQNLWCGTDGHCTKCVSSKRSWHSVHFNVAAVVAGVAGDTPSVPDDIPSGIEPPPPPPASVEVTVVDETCLEPDDLRPLDEPAKIKKMQLLAFEFLNSTLNEFKI